MHSQASKPPARGPAAALVEELTTTGGGSRVIDASQVGEVLRELEAQQEESDSGPPPKNSVEAVLEGLAGP